MSENEEKTLKTDEDTPSDSSVETNGDTENPSEETVASEDLKKTEAPSEEDEEDEEDDPEENLKEEEKTGENKQGSSEKKSFFKKKEKKKDEKAEQIALLNDKNMRLMAEFDNYRKRTEKEKSQMYDMGVSAAVLKLLPVIDNFERGLSAVKDEDKESPTYVGMDLIYRQMVKALEEIGIEPIESVGTDFDPNLHNAVMQVESEELESGKIAAEFQKGYKYKGSVVRHSMVSVVM